MHRVLAAFGALALATGVAACGEMSKTTTAPEAQAQPATTSIPKPSKKPYRQLVADCVEALGFMTSDAGNALRIESPGGRLIANLQTFPTARQAAAFASQLAVAHASGDKGVAVWLAAAGSDDRAVVADCLSP